MAEQQEKVDTLQISLLTCSPGEAAYELYGHTALRVQDWKNGTDLVFNYGIFDFDTPNFAWRFMLGETDYTIGVSQFSAFSRSYARHGRSVVQQELNLSPEENARLLSGLFADWATPHWTYRYNFIYDNCTTRAIQQIKNAVGGELVWPEEENGKRSFRDILHEFTAEASPWSDFGNDLVLGSEVDSPIDVDKQMFSPIYAERFLDAASIVDVEGVKRPLVKHKTMAVQAMPSENKLFPISPTMAVWGILIIVLALSAWEYSRRRLFRLTDYILMAVQGLAGCIVAFLFFLSVHPAVGTNWLIILLNPLPLLYLPVKIWSDKKNVRDYYYRAMAVVLVVFALSALCHVQDFPMEIYVVALILLVRTVVSLMLENKRK